MNKIFSIILLLVGLVAAFIVLSGFLAPSVCKFERSVEIKAPRELIFKNIADYTNWPKWSPWKEKDTAAKMQYIGTQGHIGAGYIWVGNKEIGSGQMTTTELVPNDHLVSHLVFTAPWHAESDATFTLTSNGGSTLVVWSFSQALGFMQRGMMLIMNLEKMIAPDYEKGLSKLKQVCENEAGSSSAASGDFEIKETEWGGNTYVAHREVVSFKALDKFFQEQMPKAHDYVTSGNMQMNGAPTGLFYNWDTVKNTSDMAVAIPVKSGKNVGGDYTELQVSKSKALMVDYYGPYDKTERAHNAIQKYLKEKGMSYKFPVIEEYITDPADEKDMSKVLTKVYYLID